MRKITKWMVLSLFLVLPFMVSAKKMKIKEFKLQNGLTVVLNEDHSKKEVFGLVLCKAGAKNDADGATGMAHYQEHMLFKGTTSLGTSNWEKEKPHIDRIIELYDQLGETTNDSVRLSIQKQINQESIAAGKYSILNETSNLINRIGGTNLNAGTGWDQTVFYNSFPPNQLERWLSLYSHRFEKPVFRAFQSELETVYEEKNMYSDNFITAIFDKFNNSFYKNHPYGQHTIIGTTEDLKNPSLTKMYDFFNTYYVPNNMALVLVGDFDSAKAEPMIKKYFSNWKYKELPESKTYPEEPFNGREEVKVKMSPIKMETIGFRSTPKGHIDELPLELFNMLLSNDKETGAFDKLAQEGKIMAAQNISMHLADYGSEIILVVPNLFFQSISKAEKIVLDELYRVRDGDFDTLELNDAKLELSLNYKLSLESFENRGNLIADHLVQGKNIQTMDSYVDQLTHISREDVIKVAQKYYGKNYLAFISKRGFPKNEVISKPQYEPIVTDTKNISSYAQQFDSIKETPISINFVDLNKDIESKDFNSRSILYKTYNPLNDIFSLEIQYKVGNQVNNKYDLVSQLMNVSSVESMTLAQLQSEFAHIGCNYSFSCDADMVTVSISGKDQDLDHCISLLSKLMKDPILNKKQLNITKKAIKSDRKMERENSSDVSGALLSYVLFNEKSDNLNRISRKELRRFKMTDFKQLWQEITSYECSVHYVGNLPLDTVYTSIDSRLHYSSNEPKQMNSVVKRKFQTITENVVYFVNREDALQSTIYFVQNGAKYNSKIMPYCEAFNAYFGDGFSSIVLQEIREYRSLAYSAFAQYIQLPDTTMNDLFIGMVGTQSDKTLEAVEVFHHLVDTMPQKPERMDYIAPYLTQKCITSRPGFRALSQTIESWKKLGYSHDPNKELFTVSKELSFDDIYELYQSYVQSKPMATIIVGNEDNIDMKTLERYGKVVRIKEKTLYRK